MICLITSKKELEEKQLDRFSVPSQFLLVRLAVGFHAAW